MHQSFLRFADALYMKVAILMALFSVVAYWAYDPLEPHNGGTWLGYTLGTVGAVLIVWLTLYGLRKRAYRSRLGTVQGWLSAHVYLGVSLLIVATLHTGFQFGLNIHTLAYVLMVAVIVSGFWGVVMYVKYPKMVTENRDNLTRKAIFREISELDRKASLLVEALGSPVDRMMITSVQLFRVGGGMVAQLSGRDSSQMMVPVMSGKKKLWKKASNTGQRRLLNILAGQVARSRDPRITAVLQELSDVVSTKASLTQKLLKDVRMQGLMELWLYLHIPLTFALLATLTAHIVSVFYYW
jgi:hypothetical protein